MSFILIAVAVTSCKLALIHDANEQSTNGASGTSLVQTSLIQLGAGAGASITPTQILETPDNTGYWIGGTTDTTLDGTLQGTPGDSNAFVAKFDRSGTKLWSIEFGPGGATKHLRPIVLTPDGSGGLWVTGSCTGGATGCTLGGTVQNGPAGTGDMVFLGRVSADGDLLFLSELAAIGTASANLYLDGGTPYLAGQCWDGMMNADQSYSSFSGTQGYIAKFDPSTGAKVWLTNLGTASGGSSGFFPVFDGAGNVYVAGSVTASGSDTWSGATVIGTRGNSDAIYGKLGSTGAKVWAKQIGAGAGKSYFASKAFFVGGNVIAVGQASGSMGTQYGTHGSFDVVVTSVTTAGAVNWTSQQGGGAGKSVTGNFYFLENLSGGPPDHRIVTIGTTTGTLGGTVYGLHGTQDLFILGINDDGTQAYASQLGMTNDSFWPSYSTPISASTGGYIIPAGLYGGGNLGGNLIGVVGTSTTFDAVLARFDATGALSWVTQAGAGGTTTTGGYDTQKVIEATSGDLYWFGNTNADLGGTSYGTAGGTQTFAISLDSSGAARWESQLGGGSGTTTKFSSAVMSSDGILRVTGTTDGDMGGIVEGTRGATDTFTLRLDSADGSRAD